MSLMATGGLSEYEQRRLRNLEENRRILGELGAFNLAPPPRTAGFTRPPSRKKQQLSMAKRPSAASKEKKSNELGDGETGENDDEALARRLAESEEAGSRRRSSRLEGRPAPKYIGQCDGYGKDDSGEDNWAPGRGQGDDDEDDEDEEESGSESDGEGGRRRRPRRRRDPGGSSSGAAAGARPSVFDRPKVEKNRPNLYGPVPSVTVGTLFETRIDACLAGIHRPTVAGIHGGTDGAYSIALSGGYEDDIDLGSHFTYTGEGGRDLKGTKANPKNLRTAPQTRDQTLSRNNAALVRSAETGQLVRVLRGYKLRSEFAPAEGYYRYDGLYRVEKWWYTTGTAGFGVYKFAFKRCADQAAAPWEPDAAESVVYDYRTDYQRQVGDSGAATATTAADADGEGGGDTADDVGGGKPVKRKRKNKSGEENNDDAEMGDVSDSEDQKEPQAAAKKPRGRPSKAAQPAASPSRKQEEIDFQALISAEAETENENANAIVDDAAPCEPGAGESTSGISRPGDAAEVAGLNEAASSAPVDETKPPRGRPRKSLAEVPPKATKSVTGNIKTTAGGRRKSAMPQPPPPPPQPATVAADAIVSPPRKRSRFYFED